MKIRVKKLLKEYSKEERSFFGDGIQALIDNPDKLYYVKEVNYMSYPEKRQALNRAWIEENIGPRLGGGAFRDAFEINGHDDKILKISNRSLQDELGDGQDTASIAEDTNQYEIDLFNQYPEFFPRVFMSDQEIEGIPRWLIIEKAKVIENNEDFDKQLLISFPALKRAMNALNTEMALNGFDDYAEYHSSAKPLDFLLGMKGSGDDGFHETELDEKLYSYFLSKSVDWASLGVSPRDLINKIMAPVWKIMTTDPKMIKFNDMVKKLRIQPSEIDAGNVGTDIATGKKFLIIDISIFDDIFEETKKPMSEMKFTINEIRRIIAEEAELVLESRRARDWIAQQDEFFRKDFQKAYDAGVTNIPDLAFLKPPGAQEVLDDAKQAYDWPDFNITDPEYLAFIEKRGGMDNHKAKAEKQLWRGLRRSDGLREDEPILRRGFRDFQALKTFYNQKVRSVLASNDVRQLKDFETATLTSGQDFSEFMNQMKSAFLDPQPEAPEPSPEIERAPEGFKAIGNVGNFELIDPSTGEGSAHCAVGTEWCTRQGQMYNHYTEGSLRLYYIFNDNLEYPNNKVALGIKDGEIQYGGYGGTAVVANDQGIENREELEQIFGGDTDEIVNKLTAYYNSDTTVKKEQVVNYLVFARKAKKLQTAPRLQYYDDILYQIGHVDYEKKEWVFEKQSHIIRIVNKIVNDKEMNKTEYYPQLKEKIRERISEIVLDPEFGNKLSNSDIEKFYDLIASVAKRKDLGLLYVFHALDEKISEAGRSEIPENIRSKMYNLAVEANEEINSKIQKFEKALEKEEQAAAALDAAIDQYDTDTIEAFHDNWEQIEAIYSRLKEIRPKIRKLRIEIGQLDYDKRASAAGIRRYDSESDDLRESTITEGGNVFKGQTDSIPLEFIEPTLEAYYEELGRLFPVYVAEFDTFQPLGSVGKKARSGDIDLAVDVQELFTNGEVNPEDIAKWGLDPEAWKERVEKLTKRARTATPSQIGWKAFLQLLADYINENSKLISADTKLIGPGTMFSLFPQFNEQGEIQIIKNEQGEVIKNEQGEIQIIGVQIDWMVGNIDWLTFSYFSDAPSDDEPLLKGLHRTQLIHALMLAKNHSFSHTKGVTNKDTGEIVAFNKEEMLSLLSELYGSPITLDDTLNFNTLFRWLQNASTTDRSRAIAAYLKILDSTNGNKDLDGTRCGYIPKVLEKIYLSLYENGALKGKFLCKEANPTLWQAVHGSIQEQADNDEKITVVIPGGFKPPHRGHVEMINHFANLPEVGEVIVFTGTKPRMSDDGSVVVTKDKSIQLFNLFDLAPNVRFGDIKQRPKKNGGTYENPFMDAVGTLFDQNFSGKKVAIGHPTKDAGYSDRFEKIVRGSTRGGKSPMVAELVRVPPADTTGDLSATDLRNAVQSGNREELARFIPEDIAEDYLRILTGD